MAMTRTSTGGTAVAADGADFAGCRTRSRRLLRRVRHCRDFVEDQRAHVGFAASGPILSANAPGKAPFAWPNSSLSMTLAGNRLAVDDDERAAGAQACAMDGAGDRFLAGAGSPTIRIGRRLRAALAAMARAARNSGDGTDQLVERERGSELFRHRGQLARGLAAVGIGGERFEQSLGRDRAGSENRWRRRASR